MLSCEKATTLIEMQNKKSLIFTSALVAGTVISVSAAELSTSQTSRYSDLGTGADVRTNILFEQQDFDLNFFVSIIRYTFYGHNWL